MKIKRLAFACLLLVSFLTAHAQTDVVKTNAGAVSGSAGSDGIIHIYKGIPFAAPPVGALRWKAPQPVQPWSDVKKCDQFSASPMQNSPAPFSMWSQEFLIPKEPISEDCLYLNVWTKSTAAKMPVLVWIYGGGFASGGSAVPIYDGEAMAKKGIVFVSINYRVGIFGFLAHPELTKESGYNASGNYGLLDQIAALKWVQQNIATFGGDANNVTIAGQSAGSMSVNCLVASPLAKGLFNKAIAESGARFLPMFGRANASLQDAENDGEKVAQSLNATSLEALRNMPAEELQQKAKGQFAPVIDGYVLPEDISKIFAAHKQNKVALLTGWNENEGLFFGQLKNAADYKKDIETQYGTNTNKFLEYYPATDDAAAATSQLNISRDMIFGVQNYTWANIENMQGNAHVYVYRFTRKVPATGEYVKYGAFHTGEVPYAYNNLKFVDRPWQPADNNLAETMSTYWANFIKTGNPNSTGLPAWPAYNTNNKMVMVLDMQPGAKPLPDSKALDFLHDALQAKR